MKKIIISLSIVALIVGFSSCEQKFPMEDPEIISFCFVQKDTIFAGATVTFELEALGDLAVIWTGLKADPEDPDAKFSDYDAFLASPSNLNRGTSIVLEWDNLKEVYTSSRGLPYKVPGTFKAVLVVSSIGYKGEVTESVTEELMLTITPLPEEE